MSESEQVAVDVSEILRHEARIARDAGQLEQAESLYRSAQDLAEESGDACAAERAFCGRASIAIELGRSEEFLSGLRQVLMRNRDNENCFLAAYNIARAYEMTKANQKALFYARIARDRAQTLDRLEWQASSHNLIGNLLLAESFFEEACGEYEQALGLVPQDSPVREALIKDNLGYSLVVQKRYAEGFRLLFESYRALRRAGARRYQILPRLSLCFAYLETGRLDRSFYHGRAVLAAAEALGDAESVKNVLYLLGEAANLQGDFDLARSYFHRLQQTYYPNADYLPDFLLAIDIRKLVNLKA